MKCDHKRHKRTSTEEKAKENQAKYYHTPAVNIKREQKRTIRTIKKSTEIMEKKPFIRYKSTK